MSFGLLSLAILICGGFVYVLLNPTTPQDPYSELHQRRAANDPSRYHHEMLMGNVREGQFLFDSLSQAEETGVVEPEFENFRPIDALEYIGSVAGGERAVFINENHDNPHDRAFTIELLHLLRQKGFTHFASEGLSHQDPGLMERGYPVQQLSGKDVHEPVYADLIRSAIQLGYTVVPYDAKDDAQMAARGASQAQNLIDAVFRKNTSAKLFAHTGPMDNNEYDEFGKMAYHFRKLSGIDPLTIDQVMMGERSDASIEKPEYGSATGRGLVQMPSLFRDEEGFWDPIVDIDLVLYRPRTRMIHGRPDWMSLGGRRRAFIVNPSEYAFTLPYLARAYVPGESPERRWLVYSYPCVPLDHTELTDRTQQKALWLYPGEYDLRFISPQGNVLGEQRIRVD